MMHRLLSLVISSLLVGCASTRTPLVTSPHRVSEVRYVMGTLLDITLYAPSEDEGRRVLDETFAVAEHLDRVLSLWRSESPATAFNRDITTAPREVDPLLYQVAHISQRLSLETEGAYDISVRPLVELWSAATKRNAPPTTIEQQEVAALIGPDRVIVLPPAMLAKRLPGVKIETGGIGKGFAVDKMVSLLRHRGISTAFINFGRSSIAAIGAPPGQSGWRIELELAEQTNEGELVLRDETLSVSRARGTPIVVAGAQYAHIFDPVTRQPLTMSRGAAVRGPSATDGEAYVKYLVIRGKPSNGVENRWSAHQWIVRTGHDVARGTVRDW